MNLPQPPKPIQLQQVMERKIYEELSLLVQDFMTTNVVAIGQDTSIIEVAQIFFERKFDGLPVVDDNNVLLGIVTQYDMVSKGANIHLPTFIQMMEKLPLYKKDKNMIDPGLKIIVSLTVKDIMNTEPITVNPNTSIETVSKLFTEHHRVNPIPVIDPQRVLIGIVSRYDIIRIYTGGMATATSLSKEGSVDRKIDLFLRHLEKNFVVVSKFRSKFWLIASILFTIVGFIIAFILITRIELNS